MSLQSKKNLVKIHPNKKSVKSSFTKRLKVNKGRSRNQLKFKRSLRASSQRPIASKKKSLKQSGGVEAPSAAPQGVPPAAPLAEQAAKAGLAEEAARQAAAAPPPADAIQTINQLNTLNVLFVDCEIIKSFGEKFEKEEFTEQDYFEALKSSLTGATNNITLLRSNRTLENILDTEMGLTPIEGKFLYEYKNEISKSENQRKPVSEIISYIQSKRFVFFEPFISNYQQYFDPEIQLYYYKILAKHYAYVK